MSESPEQKRPLPLGDPAPAADEVPTAVLESRPKPVRSYVVRAGRVTDAQRRALAEHWPRYGLQLADGPVDLQAVFGRQAPCVLEIGFGMGDSLLAMARAEPDKNFIGVEVHPPGVGRLLNNAAAADVDNLRVYLADATDVVAECLAEGSLHRIQIYFPDPWHKKKHHKRRIIQPAFVEQLARRLEPGGWLHLATDWQPYAEQMLVELEAEQQLVNTAGRGSYAQRPAFRPETKFERRGQRLGHGVWDLIFERIA